MVESLKKLNIPFKVQGPVVVIVMDGIGEGTANEGNAVYLAKKPTLDYLLKNCPHTLLKAHGTAVGLPSDGDMGNSEVGHNALGAGRVFDQGAKLVNSAIEKGTIFSTPAWKEISSRGLNGKTVHLIGLLSDGNVHSHIDQLFALIKKLADEGVKNVRLHPLLDGRDVPETSALIYIEKLEILLKEINANGTKNYKIASGGGRMVVTMDRYEADWRIVDRGWKAHVLGEGKKFKSATEAIEFYRKEQNGVTDQFLPEFVIVDDKQQPVGTINDGDAVIFFNFRGDRAIEISRAFEEKEFNKFDRVRFPEIFYAGMMQYDGDLKIPSNFLVTPPAISNTLTEYLISLDINLFAIAETQKYGHVTYFWNGNKAGLFNPVKHHYEEMQPLKETKPLYNAMSVTSKWEKYIEIPSDRITFEQRPWMKAAEVTDAIIDEMRTGKYKFLRLNFANGDMVGHTGRLEAAIMAVETVDLCIARILKVVDELKGVAIITADHGNADEMFELKKDGSFELNKEGKPKPKTSHTLNPVWFIVHDREKRFIIDENVKKPGLSNVAASILYLLGYDKPEDYEPSVIKILT